MTYEHKLSTGGYWLFTGRQAVAAAGAVAAMTPPLLAAAGAADAAPKQISPPA